MNRWRLAISLAVSLTILSGCFSTRPTRQSATLFVPVELVKGIVLSEMDIHDLRMNVLSGSGFIFYLSDEEGSPAVHYKFPHGGGRPIVYHGISKGAPISMGNWAFIQGKAEVLNWKKEDEDVWRSVRIDRLRMVELKGRRQVYIIE